MPLNEEQKSAVEYLSGPLLVLAGPGTGKTQLLSAKVAYILEHTDANPENILCLTFTDAGAENMRTRLQSMIGKAALNVNIYTYHAFGSNLLERYKNYSETFKRKLDAPIDETVQHKIIRDIMDHLSAVDILKTTDPKDIIETISSAKAARLTAADLQKIAEQNLEDSANLSAELSPILAAYGARPKFADAIANTYQPILEILVKYTSDTPITKSVERLANPLARELKGVMDVAMSAPKPLLKELSAWKTRHFEKTEDDAQPYRLSDHIANKKLLSLSHIMQEYDDTLQKSGLFDFNDMIECAIDYLKTDRGFRLSLSELFQYILLDEFQDTNASQFELIKLLTDYEKPVVMAVGDDDQAIYEFQGANASNLMDFQKHYDAEVVKLVNNYRSVGGILHASRFIADQIADSFAKNYQIDKSLISIKDQSATSGEPQQVVRHEFPCSEAEYFWIASEIRKLLDSGVSPNEIAILAPKHKNIAPILPYLKAQHIDVVYEKRDNLLEDPKIHQIIALAKFIHELADLKQPAHRLLEILSFDFWQIPADVVLETVTNVSKKAPKSALDYLKGNPDLEPLAQFFAELAVRSLDTPFELWLSYLIGQEPLGDYTSPFLSYYQSHASDFELLEFYENLITLRKTIVSHVSNLNPSRTDASSLPYLRDFITTLGDYESANLPITRISTYRDDTNAIQVMTAHKSKGLEFSYVFLTSVDDSAWGKSKGNNNRLSLPQNLVQIRHTGITDDEKLRLFFVAITRAKQKLILTSAMLDSKGAEGRRLRYLSEPSRTETEQLSPFLPEASQTIQIHVDDLTDAQKVRTLELNWISHYLQMNPNLMSLLQSRMSSFHLSASDLTSFVDIVYAGPTAFYQRRIIHAPDEPATPAICYGNILHHIFEQVTSQNLDDAAALELFHAEAPTALLAPTDLRELIEKGEHSLKIALREFGPILRHAHAKAEISLSHEHPVLDGVPLSGKIDHLEIDPAAKTIEVYDFKTSAYHRGKWDQQLTLYKYRLQLGFYKLLLNLSSTYRGYKVTRGHILFVTPDSDGRVYDKPYDFDPADEEELKSLIKSVYHQATSLDFLQNPELFVPSDKNRTLKDIKNFVAKLLEIG